MQKITPQDDTCAANIQKRLLALVQYATLAPSSHNTQCWKFDIDATNATIDILPDFDRKCPIVDPDDHHVYATLGCATENIVVAAKAHGLHANVDLSRLRELGISISFTQCEPQASKLFDAITKRQCTRAEYDGIPLTPAELSTLKSASKGNGVDAIFITNQAEIADALQFILRANTAQIQNPLFVQELTKWIRFSTHDAIDKGDGLRGECMGSRAPSVPRWIGKFVLKHFALNAQSENTKVTKQVQSSAGLVVFVSKNDNPQHWVEAGRAYERFALQATALGIKNAFLNMPVEEASVRQDFADSLGVKKDARLDFVVRFGRGEDMPRSYRRPLDEVVKYADH